MIGWLLGALWLACLKAWLAAHLPLDADALAIAELWRGVSGGLSALGRWNSGAQPGLFPDLPLWGLAAAFSGGVEAAQRAYGLCVGFFLWWYLARLLKQAWNLTGSSARAYAAAGLIAALALAAACGDSWDRVFTPGEHSGVLLVTLAVLVWSLRQEDKPSTAFGTLWTALGVGCAWVSDPLVPAWILGPSFLICLGQGGPARRRVVGMIAASWVVRALVLAWLGRQGMQVASLNWADAFTQMPARAMAAASSLAASWWSLGVPLVAGGLGWAFSGKGRKEGPQGFWFLWALALTGCSGLMVGAIQGSVDARQFLPVLWIGAALLPLAWSLRIQGQALPLVAACLVGVLLLGFGVKAGRLPEEAQAQWLSDQARIYGLKRGVADYARARPLGLLNNGGLELSPVKVVGGGLESDIRVGDRSRPALNPRPDCAVAEGLDPAAMQAALGAPIRKIQGPGLTLWVFKGNEAQR
jgi:hypothetical protein